MKTLYLDCGMGAAGDMLAAALLELLPDPDSFLEELNGMGLSGVCMEKEPAEKCGICGTHFKVVVQGEEEESLDWTGHEHTHDHGHEHSHDHGHEHSHDHGHEHSHDHGHEHMHDHGHEHSHDHGHEHMHDHGHEHSHDHGHEHSHDHHHDHTHDHGHEHMHSHSHTSMADIEHLIRDHLQLPKKVKEDVLAVYKLIAEAESAAHGMEVSQIHFHEVGAMDAVADISAVCLLMNKIAPERVICSPVHVGYGKVRCAHGILSVPVPAAAYLLKEVPIYGGKIEGELCTPTGAALLKHFVNEFGSMPIMKISRIGNGMGKKDFPAANCLRAMLGETETGPEEVFELSCNVDDMTAEAMGFAMERLFEAGALDVYTIPIGMKKNRPGTLIRVMCSENKKTDVVAALFAHTTTLGIRENRMGRYVLSRTEETLETPYGQVRRKTASGYGVNRSKLEYEDLAAIAKEQGISLKEAEKLVLEGEKKSL